MGSVQRRALVLAELHGLMAEGWTMLRLINWLGERKGCQDGAPFTVKWRILVCAS